LECAVVDRVSSADIKGFNKVVAALEQIAHQRVGSGNARPNRKREKATV
jgi:hypothetical protein